MSFGHFGAGFVEAFTSTMLAKKEQERRDKMAKLQGQLYELQLKQAQKTMDAQTQVSDMMTGQLGEFQMGQEGLGEFNITPGQSPQFVPGRATPPTLQGDAEPMGLVEMLADPEGQMAMMNAGYLTPRDLLNPRRGNSKMELIDAWKQEKDPEIKKMYETALTGGFDSAAFMAQFMADKQRAEIEKIRRENATAERTRNEEIAGAQVSIRNDFKHADEMIDIMSQLRDTAQATGNPFGDFMTTLQAGGAAAAAALGFDVREANRLIALRQRLNKLMKDGIIEGLSRFEGTGGNVQNSKMEALIDASASLGVGEFPNIQVIADIIENNLDMAKIKGIPVKNEAEQRAAIEEWRAAADALFDNQSAPVLIDGAQAIDQAIDFSKMTMQELQDFDVNKLKTPEQIEALKKRLAELKGK